MSSRPSIRERERRDTDCPNPCRAARNESGKPGVREPPNLQGGRHAHSPSRCRRPTALASHTVPGFHAGRSPRNKGRRYPADPPTVVEIVAVMRHAGPGLHAARLRALNVVLWRAGLRIHEALALGEADLDQRRGSLLVRRGKGGRRREVGMDDWAWEQLQPWINRVH